MRIESLREFVEFAKYLSFSTTAKKLYISQPALSNHIALLEKDLGVNLIERSATLRLTSAGKTFLIDAASIVDLADRAVSRCRACSRAAQGKIVIKMPIDLQKTATFFIKKIEAFKENNPAIDVELVTGANRNMFEEIHNGNIDCGLAYGYVSSDDGVCCETIDIGRNRLTLWISKNHPLAGKEPLQLKDLNGYQYPLPSNAQFYEFEHSLQDLFAASGVMPSFYYRSSETFLEFLLSCDGCKDILLGTTGIEHHPVLEMKEDMLFREFDDYSEDIPAYIVYNGDSNNPAIKQFLEHLKKQRDI